MKRSFCIFLTITLTLIGVSLTFSWRGYDAEKKRWTNRDEQKETRTSFGNYYNNGANWIKRRGEDSDKNSKEGPLKTKSYTSAENGLNEQGWFAMATLSNRDPALSKGHWHGYAKVPYKSPDTDYKYGVAGRVTRMFNRRSENLLPYPDLERSIEDCSAWSNIAMFDGVNKIHYDSYSHVPF